MGDFPEIKIKFTWYINKYEKTVGDHRGRLAGTWIETSDFDI